jgi:serine/threonine protein kinase
MIGQTISHYNITAKLGEGGMGEVYLAEDLQLGRHVAIKFLSTDKSSDADSRKRFIHEARAQAMLNHPNIATFHEVDEAEGRAFIVMEYVEGKPLPEYVVRAEDTGCDLGWVECGQHTRSSSPSSLCYSQPVLLQCYSVERPCSLKAPALQSNDLRVMKRV